MTTSGKAASVHDRLLQVARASGSDFNLILSRYALERFLYRIFASPYKDRVESLSHKKPTCGSTA